MRYLESSVTLEYDANLCNGCRMCTKVCPHQVFAMAEKRAVMADRGACMECGACARNCEPQAIRVRSGVGCAAAVLAGMLSGTKPSCGCGESSACC